MFTDPLFSFCSQRDHWKEHKSTCVKADPTTFDQRKRSQIIMLQIMGDAYSEDVHNSANSGTSEQDKADKHRQRALVLGRKHFGDSHTTTLTSMNEVAVSMMLRGDFISPIPLFEKVLLLREDDQPGISNMSVNMINLAHCYQKDGSDTSMSKAVPLLERALGIRVKQSLIDGTSSDRQTRESIYTPIGMLQTAYCQLFEVEAAVCKLTNLCQQLGIYVRLTNSQGGAGKLFGKESAPKQKPNERCLCGSGRKYKKCCKS